MYKKILLIDDDEDEQFFFTEALKEVNTPVKFFFASSAKEGMQLLKFLLPDAVFIDINMPLLNGLECLSMIKEDDSINKIPVIIYSTGVNEIVFKEAVKKGAATCVKKQDTIVDLTSVLNKIFTKDTVQ
jgi:CheY-like chemotaxis protein